MSTNSRNPHAGIPFDDGDEAIAAYLEDVSIPTLLCAMVHITGDPEWIRGDLRPVGMFLNEYQGFMDPDSMAEVRRRALPAIIEYRDGGCEPPPSPGPEVVKEMMEFVACEPVADEYLPLFLDDLHLDGADSGAVDWGGEVPDQVRADSHVVVIGCGQSGLLAGIRLQQAGLPFTIIEKNSGPGGTWWENRYPGARVDVGSHFYCYSFEPAYHWTEYFSQQPELQAYFVDVMKKYGIDDHTKFNSSVTSADFDESTGRWTVEYQAEDGSTQSIDAAAVISAVGSLNTPNMPEISGIDDFAGPSFHSARWDPSIDYHGKKVVMIGAGASGFQIAPTIADDVDHLTVIQRTAQWMFPNAHYHEEVPEGERWAMRHLPFYGRWFRFLTFWPGAGIMLDYARIDPDHDDSDAVSVSAMNAMTRDYFMGWIREQVGDDAELLEKVTPDYPAAGKRTLQDNGSWLSCLKKDNVDLVRNGIDRIVENGVITEDGTLHEADIIVYATGFRHNDYLWPMRITGRDSVVLNEHWGETPSAYLGITVPGFPNLFCMYGPGTNLAHGGSLIFHSECQINYIMDGLHKMLAKGAKAVEPRLEVHDEYVDRVQKEISTMVWSHWAVRNSHYKNSDGKVYTLSPWAIPTYWGWTRSLDPDEYLFN